MTEMTYDVVVLGAGAGGVPAAIRAAQLGGRVAVIESGNPGGLCMNKGCIPFGHMMEASNILGYLSLGKDMGLGFSEISRDYAALLKRQNELISFMRAGTMGMLSKNKVEIIEGKGQLADKDKVEVDGRIVSFKNLILATGAEWLKPDFPGSDLEEVMNSDDLLGAGELPERVLLYGRSPWLIEIAQFLYRFGSQVTLATKESRILSDESKTISSRLAKVLKNQGISILAKAEILSLKKKKDGLHSVLSVKGKEETMVVDRVIALKRGASLKGLGLTSADIDEDSDYVRTDDRMETGTKGIYAIGDVSAPEKNHYSHSASAGGIIAAENAMGLDRTMESRTIARVIFTQPQVACVGLTGKEAKKAGYDVVVGAAPLSMNPFGMILSQTEGIVEIVSEKRYGEILGMHIIGESACEMAGQAVLAMQMEGTLEELARATFPHPTLSESLPEAAREALGQAIYIP
ncbi:MAG: NAD(P)/FAD-dependent oxidoreductase [Deltaproteobacteria bacterium]|nr:NAD(P)/FAD-dependent oxidoreductase [Deltaproteobacteria bacterium]